MSKTLSFRAIPNDVLQPKESSSVWMIIGPEWRKHLNYRIINAIQSGWEVAWIGYGDLADKISPSGILNNKTDLKKLIKRWTATEGVDSMNRGKRLLVVEDPQGGGIWSEMISDTEWINMLSRSKDFKYDVIIGSGIPLPNCRLVLINTDWMMVRCSGDDGYLVMTDGSRLSNWLDAIGRDIFEDIRIYRKMLEVVAKRGRDLAISLTSDAEELTNRVFWFSRDIENTDFESEEASIINERHDSVSSVGWTAPLSTNNDRIAIKIKTAISLLQDILNDLSH
jgi:hypothetical protein